MNYMKNNLRLREFRLATHSNLIKLIHFPNIILKCILVNSRCEQSFSA